MLLDDFQSDGVSSERSCIAFLRSYGVLPHETDLKCCCKLNSEYCSGQLSMKWIRQKMRNAKTRTTMQKTQLSCEAVCTIRKPSCSSWYRFYRSIYLQTYAMSSDEFSVHLSLQQECNCGRSGATKYHVGYFAFLYIFLPFQFTLLFVSCLCKQKNEINIYIR